LQHKLGKAALACRKMAAGPAGQVDRKKMLVQYLHSFWNVKKKWKKSAESTNHF